MADGKLYLNYRGAGTADEIRRLIDTIVGELGLPEEIEDYVFVLRMGKKVVLKLRDVVQDPSEPFEIEEIFPLGIDTVKLIEVLKRWRARGWIVSRDGGFLAFSPQFGPDP